MADTHSERSTWTASERTVRQSAAYQTGEPVILFDGVCNLCNGWVDFIINRDQAGLFRFAALQSSAGTRLLAAHGLAPEMSSIVLIENEAAYSGSTAVLRICTRLDGPLRYAGVFQVVPRKIRDAVYNLIARRRYRWFGRRASCRIPAPEIKARFLDT